MKFSERRLLFYFDQYFPVRLGENLYQYKKSRDNFSILRSIMSLIAAWVRAEGTKNNMLRMQSYRHLFYMDTINQRNAVNNLLRRMDRKDVLLILFEDVSKVSLEFPEALDHLHLPPRSLYAVAIQYLLTAIRLSNFLRIKYHKRVSGSHIVINLALFLSAIRLFDRYLATFKPASVTVTNDHNLYSLAFLYAARKRQVQSIYIQHASVSPVFPALLANVALLEGKHAEDTYNKIGNFARKVKLVGISRMDGYIGHKNQEVPARLCVGLCLKAFYSKKLIRDLVEGLRQSERVESIILRPHPGSPPGFWIELEEFQSRVSDARKEDSAIFLKSIDVLVSGESTIILEATLMKIPAIYYDDDTFFYPFDLYGFVRNGIAHSVVKRPADLAGALKEIDPDRRNENFLNSRYYCSTVTTGDENRSAEILLDFYGSL